MNILYNKVKILDQIFRSKPYAVGRVMQKYGLATFEPINFSKVLDYYDIYGDVFLRDLYIALMASGGSLSFVEGVENVANTDPEQKGKFWSFLQDAFETIDDNKDSIGSIINYFNNKGNNDSTDMPTPTVIMPPTPQPVPQPAPNTNKGLDNNILLVVAGVGLLIALAVFFK